MLRLGKSFPMGSLPKESMISDNASLVVKARRKRTGKVLRRLTASQYAHKCYTELTPLSSNNTATSFLKENPTYLQSDQVANLTRQA